MRFTFDEKSGKPVPYLNKYVIELEFMSGDEEYYEIIQAPVLSPEKTSNWFKFEKDYNQLSWDDQGRGGGPVPKLLEKYGLGNFDWPMDVIIYKRQATLTNVRLWYYDNSATKFAAQVVD